MRIWIVAGLVVGLLWQLLGVGALAVGIIVAIVLGALTAPQRPMPIVVDRLPTQYERRRRSHTRWIPGIGISIWPPRLFATLWRWRRW